MTKSDPMEQCIQECFRCHEICQDTLVNHCLKMGGSHMAPEHVRLMLDCIEICQASANFLIRKSERHQLTCRVCAEVCRKCADSCTHFNTPEMTKCAEQCQRCASICQSMAA